MVGAGRFERPTSSPLRRELLFFLSLPVPFRCFPSLDLRGSGQDPGEAWPMLSAGPLAVRSHGPVGVHSESENHEPAENKLSKFCLYS
jgi:hypothetical protein